MIPPLVAETEHYRVYQVRWPVLEDVFGEGLLLEPAGERGPYRGPARCGPDAGADRGPAPGVAPGQQFARRLAENGFAGRGPDADRSQFRWSGHPEIRMTDQSHREWIYRQAFHMGRHVIGYEVQKVLAAVDWFERTRGGQGGIGVAGYGEGGLIAFYAAAVDTRIDAALVSGYFELAAGRLVRADLPQRVGVAARVRRRGNGYPDRAARPGGRI